MDLNSPNPANNVPSSGFTIQEAKMWFQNNYGKRVMSRGNGVDAFEFASPNWDSTVNTKDANYFVMEVPGIFTKKVVPSNDTTIPSPSTHTVTKFLLLKSIKDSSIQPIIMDVVSTITAKPENFHYASFPKNFSGSVYYLHPDALVMNGWIYSNGLVLKNITSDPIDCTEQTTGWFSTTCYYTAGGSLNYCDEPILLYTITLTTCLGGGGGGATPLPPNPCQNTQQQGQAFLNEGVATSTMGGETINSQTSSTFQKTYRWQIFSAVTWFIDSYEQGSAQNVHYTSPNYYRWEFTDFHHVNLSARGINLGGTRTYQDISNNINISKTKQEVLVDEYYAVTSNVAGIPACNVTPLSGTVSYHSGPIQFWAAGN